MDLVCSDADGVDRSTNFVSFKMSRKISCRKHKSISTTEFVQPSLSVNGQHVRDHIVYSREEKLNILEYLVCQETERKEINSNDGTLKKESQTVEFYHRKGKREVVITRHNESLKDMRSEVVSWINDTKKCIRCLREIADEIESVFQKASKAKIGGSAASIAGGIVSIVGFGLSFATFGSSLILCIVGGAVAGAGGITTGTASVVNAIKASSKKKAADEAVKKYNDQLEKIKRKCIEISEGIKNIDDRIPEWVDFWVRLTHDGTTKVVGATWSAVQSSITTSLKITASLAGDASNAGKTVVRMAGTAARGAHIAGGVVGILLLPIDLHTLISSSLDVGNRKIPDSAKAIRTLADRIEWQLPNIDDVDNMITCTIERLEEYYPGDTFLRRRTRKTYGRYETI